ncbi:MAG TPA: hypothetical protein DCE42_28620 [Myxococcales bacterium]|nr:hypothetical protein [Deltaproteobacteria bacterium]HAA58760.1 hypothetical protein [Myxococcales bacterium]|tara:strand:+ start:8202 stop:10232 length:2031 start_codon:yes stop_codon:yes gene_type:complete
MNVLSARQWATSILLGTVLTALIGLTGVVLSVYTVTYPVAQLSPERDGPLLIEDRHGVLLRSIPREGGRPGRQAWTQLSDIPSIAVNTLLASEDANFFTHKGVDFQAISRALFLNLKERRKGYGASTITMQLMKNVHSPGMPRNLYNKIKEAILALRVERVMRKHHILEQYVNRVYFGRGAYGIEAAARTYFNKPATSLSIGEATLLCVLPRSPMYYDLVRHRDRALVRRKQLFYLLQKRGLLTKDQIKRAEQQTITLDVTRTPFKAPHFVDALLKRLPKTYSQRGGTIRTTIDATVQARMEAFIEDHVTSMKKYGIKQAGAVILDSKTGEIVSMVGSKNYNKPEGQINITMWRRYPGSALKPFAYALAMEDGASPASIVYEIQRWPASFGILTSRQRERGPVSFREALAGSYNISALQAVERVGVARMISRLKAAGLGPLDGSPSTYGHQIVLGSPKIRLLDLASAYGFLVRQGKVISPRWYKHHTDAQGTQTSSPPQKEHEVYSALTSWLTMDILSDEGARHHVFGMELPVDLPYKVAVKTGTAQGFADTVAVGITSEYTVAAWAGTFDGKPIKGMWAMYTAGPIVRAGLLYASKGKRLHLPPKPEGIRTQKVCTLSGMTPNEHCPNTRLEHFHRSRPRPHRCNWHVVRDGHLEVHYPKPAHIWAKRRRLHRLQ